MRANWSARQRHQAFGFAAALLVAVLAFLAPPARGAEVFTENFVVEETTFDDITSLYCGFPVEQHVVWRVIHHSQSVAGKRSHEFLGGPATYTWTNLTTGRSIEFFEALAFKDTFVERTSSFKSVSLIVGLNYRLRTPETTFAAAGSIATAFEGTFDATGALVDFDVTGHVLTPHLLHVYPVTCVFLGATDSDGDYLPDTQGIRTEKSFGTDPTNRDTDGDGYLDGIEVANETDPRIAASHPQGAIGDADKDDDFLADGVEVLGYGTDPTNPDTDADGFLDGVEVIAGTDPTKRRSHP